MAVTGVHQGARRHVRACREATWGQCPPSPQWHCIPVFADGYTVKAADRKLRPRTLVGGWQRSVHLSYLQVVEGRWSALLYPEVAEFLLDMALERTGGQLHSYCVDHYTPPDPRRHLGCMVESARLECSGRGSAVLWHMALRGRQEQENDALSEEDFDYSGLTPVPFCFQGATLQMDASPVGDVEACTITVRNNLRAGPSSGGLLAYLIAGQRAVSLELTKLNDSDLFNAAIRSGGTLSFSAVLSHPSGWELGIQLPRLYVDESAEPAMPGALVTSRTRLEAGVDESGVDMSYTLGEP